MARERAAVARSAGGHFTARRMWRQSLFGVDFSAWTWQRDIQGRRGHRRQGSILQEEPHVFQRPRKCDRGNVCLKATRFRCWMASERSPSFRLGEGGTTAPTAILDTDHTDRHGEENLESVSSVNSVSNSREDQVDERSG